MNYRIRFHPLVQRDLDTIAHWIIDHAGVEVAHRKLNEIEQTIMDLAHPPHRDRSGMTSCPDCGPSPQLEEP